MKNKIIIFIALCLFSLTVKSQEKEVLTVQPSIMILPLTKEGEDIRTIIEDNFDMRVGFTKINEAFNQRGFSTIDFRTKLKQILKMQAMEMTNQQSLRQALIENSTAEIIVEFDMNVVKNGGSQEVVINLNAFDAYSAQTLSSEICRSGQWSGVDVSKLTEKAISNKIEGFLNTMNDKFTDIVENGRSIIVNITFDENSNYSMYSEVGPDEFPLSDVLELWFEENAYKNYYRIAGVTETKMMLDEVKIPLKDPKNGTNYTARKFSLKLYSFLKSELGISCEKDADNTAVYITIL